MQEEDLSFLPFFLTEPLYLVPEPEAVMVVKEKEEVDWQPEQANPAPPSYEGQNKQEVLILYHAQKAGLPAEHRTLLFKILQAVKLSLKDVALCNCTMIKAGDMDTLNLIPATKIIIFGNVPAGWSLQHLFQKYHITQENNQKHLLQVDDLSKIAQSRELKTALWKALQQLFQI